MARNFQVLDRDPSGAVWTLSVPAGDGFVAEPNHAYRIIVDAGTTLPAGSTVRRVGRDLKIRLPDGDEITVKLRPTVPLGLTTRLSFMGFLPLLRSAQTFSPPKLIGRGLGRSPW